MPHFDMLHPARKLWRRRSIASAVPPRALVRRPARRERQLRARRPRGGHPRCRARSTMCRASRFRRGTSPTCARATWRRSTAVFEHNRLDLLSLAALTAIAAQMAAKGRPATPSPHEALAMGRIYARLGRWAEADACFSRAAGLGDAPWDVTESIDASIRADALRQLAIERRRRRRYDGRGGGLGAAAGGGRRARRPRRKRGGPSPSTTSIAHATSRRRGSSPSTRWRRNRIPRKPTRSGIGSRGSNASSVDPSRPLPWSNSPTRPGRRLTLAVSFAPWTATATRSARRHDAGTRRAALGRREGARLGRGRRAQGDGADARRHAPGRPTSIARRTRRRRCRPSSCARPTTSTSGTCATACRAT